MGGTDVRLSEIFFLSFVFHSPSPRVERLLLDSVSLVLRNSACRLLGRKAARPIAFHAQVQSVSNITLILLQKPCDSSLVALCLRLYYLPFKMGLILRLIPYLVANTSRLVANTSRLTEKCVFTGQSHRKGQGRIWIPHRRRVKEDRGYVVSGCENIMFPGYNLTVTWTPHSVKKWYKYYKV